MIRDILAAWTRRAATWTMLGLALALLSGGRQALAQSGNPYAPAAFVNDRAITNYELDQRILLLELFRTPGDLQEVAMEQLIDDRLRLDAAASMEIEITQEDIDAALEEFAGRANMTTDVFLQGLAAEGVAEQTLRDFLRAGAGWRRVVQTRFGPRSQVSDAEVDRALALTSRSGGAVVELAEIYLPARNPEELALSQEIASEILRTVRSTADFSAAARQYSVAPTAANGGRTGRAVPIANLPPPLRSQVLTLAPGEMSEPIQGGDVLALFQMISLRETGISEAEAVSIEYVEYLIPGGRSEEALKAAAKVAARVDTCDDFYGVNRKDAPERLTVHTLPVGEVPRDVSLELAKLDEGETSIALTRGQNLVMLMLCSRTPALDEEVDLESVRRGLFGQRLAAYGDGYLAQLRADAFIRYP